MEASEEGDVALMKEFNKSLYGKSTGQTVPESLEGKVTNERILEMFRDCYNDLYNSASTGECMIEIKNKLQGLISDNSVWEVRKITGKVIK